MTRRQLARMLSIDIVKQGLHYVNGTTVFCSTEGIWAAWPGAVDRYPPPSSTQWYATIGWDRVAPRNTPERIEEELRKIEKQRTGKAKYIDRKSFKRKY